MNIRNYRRLPAIVQRLTPYSRGNHLAEFGGAEPDSLRALVLSVAIYPRGNRVHVDPFGGEAHSCSQIAFVNCATPPWPGIEAGHAMHST